MYPWWLVSAFFQDQAVHYRCQNVEEDISTVCVLLRPQLCA